MRGEGFVRYYSGENELPPEGVSDRHQFKLKWKCPACGHGWEARLNSFPDHRPVCPECEPWHYRAPSKKKTVTPGTTDLATKSPDVVPMWDVRKNGGRKPETTPYKSRDEVWWICPECGRSWKGPVFYVTNKNSARCPECIKERKERRRAEKRRLEEKREARRKLMEQQGADLSKTTNYGHPLIPGVNDLASQHPHLVAEWHPTKNDGLLPSDVARGSGRKVWWLCPECGNEWQAAVATRTAGWGKCKACRERERSAKKNE